ncbi:MAG TPA: hypothetical protein VFC37_09115, partial [Terracidiphilus sp.]|nr:hypothetical protein [Terracidiphilus sp.]
TDAREQRCQAGQVSRLFTNLSKGDAKRPKTTCPEQKTADADGDAPRPQAAAAGLGFQEGDDGENEETG